MQQQLHTLADVALEVAFEADEQVQLIVLSHSIKYFFLNIYLIRQPQQYQSNLQILQLLLTLQQQQFQQ